MEDWEIEFEWLRIRHFVKDSLNRKELPDLNGVLYMIGVQELGYWTEPFTKEQKQDLMHIAVCRLLAYDNYYDFMGRDQDGWPHYKLIKPIKENILKNLAFVAFFFLLMTSCNQGPVHALISTEKGDIKIMLYDSTPRHKANFVKLVKEGYYDELLFHRVMKGFMIQGGDPNSKNAPPGGTLGNGGPGYTIDHEIGAPHIRGAVAAARQPDAVNPEKKSSGSQFYIVDGRKSSAQQIESFERQKGIKYNDVQKKLYMEKGGAASLDGDYTVFGEVIEGMDVVDEIASMPKDPANRPIQDIKMTIKIVK